MIMGTFTNVQGHGGGEIDAGNIPNTPAGNISSTTAQAALNELDAEKAALAGATFTGGVNLSGPVTQGVPWVKVGTGTVLSSDPGITVSRVLDTGSGGAHGIDDNTVFSRLGGGATAYASFVAGAQMAGTANFDHCAAFQEDGTMSTTGTITNKLGFSSNPNITAGTLTNRFGAYIYDVSGAGTVVNNSGIFIAPLTKGTTTNYAIHQSGATTSLFEGLVIHGSSRAGNTTDGIAITGNAGGGNISGFDINSVDFNAINFYTGAVASLVLDTSSRTIATILRSPNPIQQITTGAAAVAGNAVLVAGTVTVNTTAVKTASVVNLTRKTAGGTLGTSETYTIINGVSFTITSNNVLDTSAFSWFIVDTY